MTHPYTRFRLRLARHALAQLAARLRGSAEIVMFVLGPTLVGLLAFAAMPAMLAAAEPLPLALPLLCLHGVAMSLPIVLLRPRVMPAHVRAWLHPLPVPPGLLLRASAVVATLLTGPLGLAYTASLAVWLYQRPDWLVPPRAVAGTVLSFLLTWTCATVLLVRGAGLPQRARRAPAVAAAGTHPPASRIGALYLWRRLFWLPLWRGNVAGARQCVLLAATAGAAALWMMGPQAMPRVLGAVLTSILLVLLVHDADQALRTQLARVRVPAAGWPIDVAALARHARAMTLLILTPALAVLTCMGAAAGAWHGTAAHLFLALAWGIAPLLVLTPPFTARGRMALVAFAIMLLCATGSKLWE
ncbi:hypothetical protein [Massilia luteola]|uniref:hypothetical protein n=1 Tax=Massilia luteola TaxID=3081751 RepID=UPI002ACC0E65|nr:hypothetical protein [Massilia sp. Gc5]